MLAEIGREEPDLVVFCGDLTWGSLPRETLALVRALEIPARFVRGNADRAVGSDLEHARGPWMASMHTEEDLAFLATFEPTVTDVEAAVEQMLATDDPRVEAIAQMMLEPPTREESIAHAEEVVFAG